MISKAQPDMFSKLIELEAKRAIEELRHRYWFAILDKDVESLSSCFDENACLDYGFDIKLEGRNNIKEFFSGILGNSKLIIQVPRGTNGTITLESHDTARGRWLVEVVTLREGEEHGTRIGLQYIEHYAHHSDGWVICKMKNSYQYYEEMTLKQSPF